MSILYGKSSPYYLTSQVGSYLGVINFRNIPYQSDDVQFTITSQYEFRPDLLAFDLYENVNLWWVFAVRNKDLIKDPIYDFLAGQTIYLPKMSTLKTILGN